MIVLGSSGSIGRATLDLAQTYNIEIEGLCVNHNIEILNKQIQTFNPRFVIIGNKKSKKLLDPSFKGIVYCGESGLLKALEESDSSLVVNALVGSLGLQPTLCALKCGKKVALANKESLVAGGFLITKYLCNIIPVDSEHFSLAYLLGYFDNNRTHKKDFNQLIITASGGAFRDIDISLIPNQKAKEALKHPNWKMGNKITIDSASMANKLFEILEAFWLFGNKKINGLIERNSSIHALVEFLDGSITAHFARADMRLPIFYAIKNANSKQYAALRDTLTISNKVPPLDLVNLSIKLQEIDAKRYPLWSLRESLLNEPKLGIIINAANEVAVKYFLKDAITFGAISQLCFESLDKYAHQVTQIRSIEEILDLDKQVRDFCTSKIKKD